MTTARRIPPITTRSQHDVANESSSSSSNDEISSELLLLHSSRQQQQQSALRISASSTIPEDTSTVLCSGATTTTTQSCWPNNKQPISCRCKVCARLGYRPRPAVESLLFHSLEVFDIDFGLFELIRRVDDGDQFLLDAAVARETAALASKHVEHFRNKLYQVGLLHGQEQNYVGESRHHARVMALFERSEITLGRLLGTGGFSSVYEIEAFCPCQSNDQLLTLQERDARQYVANHTMRMPENNNNNNNNATPIARYAVKHLRHNLTSNIERFQRAAVDLVLEGQLLLALDHPSIISVRGWSLDGPQAYQSGRHSDYYLILDRLPHTLDERIGEWRQQYRRYRRRLPFQRNKYTAKFAALFQKRMQIAFDIASAMVYLHDKRIINRDIKTANIGFDVHDRVKVFDFGLARLLPAEEEADQDGRFVMSRVGTKTYMAPEVQKKNPYSLSADVYSFGVVLWEILTLSSPPKTKPTTTMSKNKRTSHNNNNNNAFPVCPCWPGDIQQLVKSCLATDPVERPTMVEVCRVLQGHVDDGHDFGRQYKRRRSTFRIDLSEFAKDTKLRGTTGGCAASSTSRTSSLDEGLFSYNKRSSCGEVLLPVLQQDAAS